MGVNPSEAGSIKYLNYSKKCPNCDSLKIQGFAFDALNSEKLLGTVKFTCECKDCGYIIGSVEVDPKDTISLITDRKF